MPGPMNKVSVALNGGVDEQGASELSAPIAQQGASLTLRRSENTRLSPFRGTCTRSPGITEKASPGGVIHAVVPSTSGRNSLFVGRENNFILGPTGSYTENGGGQIFPQIVTTSSVTQSEMWLPGQIAASGAVPSEPSLCRTLSTFDSVNDHVYHATAVYDPADGFYYAVAHVTDTSGGMIATPRRVISTVNVINCIGLTYHGQYGVRLWLGTVAGITAVPLSYSGDNVISASGSALVALSGNGEQFAVAQGAFVNADGTLDATLEKYAYITVRSGLDATINRVDVSAAYAITSLTVVGAGAGAASNFGAGSMSAAICVSTTFSGLRVGASFLSDTTLTSVTVAGDLSSPAVATKAVATNARVACQWIRDDVDRLITLVSPTASAGPDIAIRVFELPNGATTYPAELRPLPWMALASTGGQLRFTSTLAYPVFELVRFYGSDNDTVVSPDYVPDPDVQLWLFGQNGGRAPIARYGTVRGSLAPARVTVFEHLYSSGGPVFLGASNLWTSYEKERGGDVDTTPRLSRWLVLEFPTSQPGIAVDRDGVSKVAATVPLDWDGTLPMEMGGPLYFPHVTAEAEPGFWTAGDYIIAAIYEWFDAAGLLHRSTAGQVLITLAGGESPLVFVTAPTATMRDGLLDTDVQCILYTSTVTDTTLRRHSAVGVRGTYGWEFSSLVPPEEGDPVIYSSGGAAEEQMPQPPPPLFDITIVGDRAWGIDAEVRSRIVYSKRRVAGVGFEWHPSYEVHLPSGAGRAVAIREWQGAVIVFAETAIFVISGDGPDNLVGNPSGGGFSKPQKVSDVGASNRHSVLSTPRGIVFQRDEDMMLCAGGAPAAMTGPRAESDCVGSFLLRDQDEAVFFFGSTAKVWNYALDRWTTWDYTGVDVLRTAPLPYDRERVILTTNAAEPEIYLIDSATKSTEPMLWETDWLVLGGDFQDHVNVQHLVFSARSEGSHGVQIDIFTDYNDTTPSTTRTWSAAEIASLATLGNNRYTLKVQPTNRGTRAVKIRLAETSPAASAMVPVALTLYYSLEANLMEPAIRPGAFK